MDDVDHEVTTREAVGGRVTAMEQQLWIIGMREQRVDSSLLKDRQQAGWAGPSLSVLCAVRGALL